MKGIALKRKVFTISSTEDKEMFSSIYHNTKIIVLYKKINPI